MSPLASPAHLRELFARHAPRLVALAGMLGVPRADRKALVDTLLDDVALSLIERDVPPLNLSRYLDAALRNRVRNDRRDNRRRLATDESAYLHLATDERVVAEAYSQFGLVSAFPEEIDPPAPRQEIVGLLGWVAAQLTDTDLEVLGGGRQGVTKNTARVQLHRLRARMRRMVPAYVATLSGPEHQEVERLLRRAEVLPSQHYQPTTQAAL